MHQVRIIDPSALRVVLERVKQLRGGTDRRTAEFLGIEQPTFTRLRNGTTTQFVHPSTYDAIRRALRGDPVEFGLLGRLEGAFLQGEAWLALQQFQSWAEREDTRLRDCGASVVFDELYGIPAYRSHFDRLLQRTGRNGLPADDDLRAWIALFRMVEPLSSSGPSGGIMPAWAELQEKDEEDLHFYLRAAERKERALLGKESIFDRISDRALQASEDYKAWLAGAGES